MRPTPRLARPHRRPTLLGLGLAVPLALLTACASGAPAADTTAGTQGTAETPGATAATEAAAATPRLALTYDGGVLVLDATTLETLADLPLDGFTRLNAAGDDRHLLVSTAGGFQALDLGAWGEPHGDHAHYWTAEPQLTDVVHPAEEPGHVVVHDGRTALFDDGTGHVVVLDSTHVTDPDDSQADTRELTTPSAHHGVAVELTDGTLVVTEGTHDARTGIRVLDAHDQEIASTDACPGVHGESVAADEAVVIGCEDGALVVTDGQITKVASPDAYGRIGNQSGTPVSPIILGDYKSDPEAELERPVRVSLIDTRTAALTLVDLPSSYSFRSLGRGEDGEALVLGTDGSLHVIDPVTATLTRSIPVVSPWEESLVWQEPRPTLFVMDGTAYITEPATSTLYAVDVQTGEIWNSVRLAQVPNELNGVGGDIAEGAEHAEHED